MQPAMQDGLIYCYIPNLTVKTENENKKAPLWTSIWNGWKLRPVSLWNKKISNR